MERDLPQTDLLPKDPQHPELVQAKPGALSFIQAFHGGGRGPILESSLSVSQVMH